MSRSEPPPRAGLTIRLESGEAEIVSSQYAHGLLDGEREHTVQVPVHGEIGRKTSGFTENTGLDHFFNSIGDGLESGPHGSASLLISAHAYEGKDEGKQREKDTTLLTP